MSTVLLICMLNLCDLTNLFVSWKCHVQEHYIQFTFISVLSQPEYLNFFFPFPNYQFIVLTIARSFEYLALCPLKQNLELHEQVRSSTELVTHDQRDKALPKSSVKDNNMKYSDEKKIILDMQYVFYAV